MHSLHTLVVLMAVVTHASSAEAQTPIPQPPQATPVPSKFRSAEDGWLDVSGFLDEKDGFLPLVIPITEPAVGYGAAAGVAFIGKPLGETQAGFGRPSITIAGGLGTENGSWGGLAGDVRHWFDDRLQTQTRGTDHAVRGRGDRAN